MDHGRAPFPDSGTTVTERLLIGNLRPRWPRTRAGVRPPGGPVAHRPSPVDGFAVCKIANSGASEAWRAREAGKAKGGCWCGFSVGPVGVSGRFSGCQCQVQIDGHSAARTVRGSRSELAEALCTPSLAVFLRLLCFSCESQTRKFADCARCTTTSTCIDSFISANGRIGLPTTTDESDKSDKSAWRDNSTPHPVV